MPTSFLARRSILVLLATAVAFVAAAGLLSNVSAANLVANGGFETGNTSSWSVSGDVDVVASSGWQSSEGSYSLDLNGFGPASISQSFSTSPGKQYQVLFDLAGNPGNGGIVTGTVSAAGQSANFSFNTSGKSTANMGWTPQTFNFTANAAVTTLTFTSTTNGPLCLSGQYAACGPALDNIRVELVNAAPAVNANSASVTVTEGATAANTGGYNDSDGDNVSISASVGTVNKTGTSIGTWS